MKKRNSKIVKTTAESAEPTIYFQLATKLLGREPKKSPLVVPWLDMNTMEVIKAAQFVGDLSEEDDCRLCALVGLSLNEWERLSETGRIGFMEKVIPNPPDDCADYRDGPNGPLLTVAVCKDRYRVSGKELSLNDEAKLTRRKNPAGRGKAKRIDSRSASPTQV